ncbi:hypothetical protein vB_AbaM_Acibel004_82 [Acinetobacter phage vB_AbaM_Acibel004]|uniref:hypothetical protein n=1 Tax=Acinetobacter phage vB_AbaM_Acibel004 TaxID=1481186 RepID=UPI0004E842F8|nr:hypothetical protein vB_AbaM_Acibel004_82 [Acinetobacter phage vB_AbaM_Acibel004]AHY26697.1 hypothetical protein vB_AbaM_Acibel004_82 [Acinetobacter phage vB_AbaM_Acibel004]
MANDFGINFAIELLENAEHEAMNLLNSMGYDVHINNLYKVIEIAYNKELYLNRFKCTINSNEFYIISDIYHNQMIIKTKNSCILCVVLETINGYNAVTFEMD